MLRKITIAASLLVLAAAAVITVNGLIAFPDTNPLLVLSAALRLELTGADIVPLTETTFMQKAGSEDPLTRHLRELDWEYEDRVGSVISYRRDGLQLLAGSQMLTRRYVVYELHGPSQLETLRGLSPRGSKPDIAQTLVSVLLVTAVAGALYAFFRRSSRP